MSDELTRLLYCSHAQVGDADGCGAVLGDLLRTSRANNVRNGLTGALLFTVAYFAQILEGTADAVEHTFQRVRLDKRHSDIVVLARYPIVAREFPDWAMALSINGPLAEELAPEVFSRAFAAPDDAVAAEVADLVRQGITAVQIW